MFQANVFDDIFLLKITISFLLEIHKLMSFFAFIDSVIADFFSSFNLFLFVNFEDFFECALE